MLVWITQGCISEDEPSGPVLGPGDPLPQFSVIDNRGNIISTSDFRDKTGVIIFFNTGCKDCRAEFPVIQQVWEKYQGNPEVVLIAIAREEGEEEISAYWKENNLTIPWSAQENRDVYSLFAPSVIPRIYISDSKCVITASFDDSDMPSYSQLIEAIENS